MDPTGFVLGTVVRIVDGHAVMSIAGREELVSSGAIPERIFYPLRTVPAGWKVIRVSTFEHGSEYVLEGPRGVTLAFSRKYGQVFWTYNNHGHVEFRCPWQQ